MAQVGLEPTASLVLSESGLPDCLPSQPLCELSKSSFLSSGGRSRTHTHWFKASEPTISRPRNRWRVPCGNRTHLTGLEDQSLRRSAKGTVVSGRRGSRTLKARARPFSGRLPSPIGLPFRSLDGWIRTSVLRRPRPADETRLSYIQILQWDPRDLNPHHPG
jgi:hypothetical protein